MKEQAKSNSETACNPFVDWKMTYRIANSWILAAFQREKNDVVFQKSSMHSTFGLEKEASKKKIEYSLVMQMYSDRRKSRIWSLINNLSNLERLLDYNWKWNMIWAESKKKYLK